MSANEEVINLRGRVEKLLGWEPGASNCFSLPTLRDMIRGKDEKLFYLLTDRIRSGRHLRGEP